MRKFFVAAFCFVAFSLTGTANANTILKTVAGDGDYLLGEVFVPGDLRGGQVTRDAAAVNGLLALDCTGCYSGTTDPSYYRSDNYPTDSFDAAVTAGAQVSGGSLVVSGNIASLTLSQSYQYLIVTYDGPNGGATVWYIGGIAAGETLDFARYAYPTGTENVNQHLVENTTTTQYGITHWTLLNPTTSTTSVPDGGATLVLLGCALIGIAALQRRFRV